MAISACLAIEQKNPVLTYSNTASFGGKPSLTTNCPEISREKAKCINNKKPTPWDRANREIKEKTNFGDRPTTIVPIEIWPSRFDPCLLCSMTGVESHVLQSLMQKSAFSELNIPAEAGTKFPFGTPRINQVRANLEHWEIMHQRPKQRLAFVTYLLA